jgi:hypothetical protein
MELLITLAQIGIVLWIIGLISSMVLQWWIWRSMR